MTEKSDGPDLRQLAHDLLPELTTRPAPRRRWHSPVLVLVTTLATLLVLAVVSAGTWGWVTRDRLGSQHLTAATALSAGLAADVVRAAAAAPVTAAPIVLTYHDVTLTASTSKYRVTAKNFAAQMKMLHDAGYRTLTTQQFLDYARGGPQPHRSVLLTFDDGTAGNWTYVDPILKQYGFHAVVFTITGRVGTHAPYYLTWRQIETMQASGRWDFESHTHDLHERVVTGPDGALGSMLVNQLYQNNHQQSLAAFESSVTNDLHESVKDLTDHGLPRPQLFSYPFSDLFAHTFNPKGATFTQRTVQGLFPISFIDIDPAPLPASRRALTDRPVQRLEVRAVDSPESLFAQIQQMVTIPVRALDPVRTSGRWVEEGGHPAPIVTSGDTVQPVAKSLRYVEAGWAPQATSDWTDYLFSADVTQLTAANTGTLVVGYGGSGALRVRVGLNTATVEQATDGSLVASTSVGSSSDHHLVITVQGGTTTVVVDGVTVAAVPSVAGVSGYGGIGIAAFRHAVTDSFPVFSTLRVDPAPS